MLGRTGVFELLVVTDRIRDLIRENPNLTAIRHEAVKNGMKYLQDDGLLQVIEGAHIDSGTPAGVQIGTSFRDKGQWLFSLYTVLVMAIVAYAFWKEGPC